MKWDNAGDQVPFVGRRVLTHGVHAWAVVVSNASGRLMVYLSVRAIATDLKWRPGIWGVPSQVLNARPIVS
jgi:hypothetical protein